MTLRPGLAACACLFLAPKEARTIAEMVKGEEAQRLIARFMDR